MATDICEHFGKRLRRLRTDRGWSQGELAHRVGIGISFLSELENGKAEPCLRKMKEMSARDFGYLDSVRVVIFSSCLPKNALQR